MNQNDNQCYGINFCDSIFINSFASKDLWWNAYLAGNKINVYYDLNFNQNLFLKKNYLSEWIELSVN